MPFPVICLRCQTPLPTAPASGVCPSCGSRVTAETPPGQTTHATSIPSIDRPISPTATLADPQQRPTRTQDQFGPLDSPLPILPGYHELTPLGVGGMGVVYQTIHRRTARPAAVKFLHAVGALDPDLRTRFSNEALALARVRHPSVVDVFEVGVADGRPFIAMEFIAGETLSHRLRTAPLSPQEAAEIMARVAAAVEAAHRAKVLHRDLKPGNILLDARGSPKVSDFGLAKLRDLDDRMTVTGNAVGTPAYMAPEQAAGQPQSLDERTDVFGLGAIFYELLCGRAPFQSSSQAESIQLALAGVVVPPSKRRPDVPAELEAVCLRCLAKSPADRYQTAREVADELNRWLEGKPTRQQPPTRIQKVKGSVKRRWKTLTAVGLVMLTVAGGMVGAWEMDPRRQIERKLSRGEEVEVVPAKGPPSWSEWDAGDAKLTESDEKDGTCGFQTNTVSLLTLVRDPMINSYRFSAELRHIQAANDGAAVGLFVALRDVPAHQEVQTKRFYTFEYTDFWRIAEQQLPRLQPKHGLDCRDSLLTRDGKLSRTSTVHAGNFHFTPTHLAPNGWRRIELDVTPFGVNAYWDPVDDSTPPVLIIPAVQYERTTLTHNVSNAKFFPGFSIPEQPWNPRGALGVYARNSVIAIRNVKIRPLLTP